MSGFELWRQDDNGNRFLVSGHAERADAEAARAAMEAGVQHKQLYYVVVRETQDSETEGAASRTLETS
ncbi:hypothetical protein [Catenulispora rubra]|uniref:hypothetical protein n=1 Tax=Catenulispora rubra TaxID=280293 RepID=UPI001E53E5AF|nr:hypothetical protein [Catenulispora rubra]